MKRNLSSFMIVLVLLVSTLFSSNTSLAAADIDKPELLSISIDKTKAFAGDDINITAKVRDKGGSGVSDVSITYSSPITGKWHHVFLDKVDETTFSGKIKLNDTFEEGKWKVSTIHLSDSARNYIDYNDKDGDFGWTKQNILDLRHIHFEFKENSDTVQSPPTNGERPPFVPDKLLYDNEKIENVLNTVKVEYKNKVIFEKVYIRNGTVDATIKDILTNIDSNKYYYYAVEVKKSTILYLKNDLQYQGPYNDIVIKVKSYEDLNRPVITPPVSTETPTNEKPTKEVPKIDNVTTEMPTVEVVTTEKPVVKPAIKVSKPVITNKFIGDNTNVVKGIADTNATVYAVANNKFIGSAKTANGKFSMKIPPQKAGTKVSFYAFANKKKSSKVYFTVVDKTGPKLSSVNTVTTKTNAITGKGEAKAKVYVYNGKKLIGSSIVSTKKTFSVKIKAQKRNTNLSVYLVDNAGNKSTVKNIKVS